MIAEAAEVVPDLWESVGDWVCWINHVGEISDTGANVYASWSRDRGHKAPHAHLSLGSGPLSIGLSLLPEQARELAAQLVRAAGLAEATQAALDEELQKVS